MADNTAQLITADASGQLDSKPGATAETVETVEVEETTTDWEAEAKKWKALSRKNEDNFKAASSKLSDLEKAQMSDSEKALAEAREEGRNAALRELMEERAKDKLEAAAARKQVDISDILDDINIGRYVANGTVDVASIEALVDKFAEKTANKPKGRSARDLGVGPNQGSGPSQLTRADLAKMTPKQIAEADAEGRLANLKKGL